RSEIDELDLLQGLALLIDQHQAGAAGKPRQHGPGFGEELLNGAMAAVAGDASLDVAPLLLAHFADFEQPVDEQAQAGLGGKPAGASMRGVDKAELLEVGHDVAHRGGRQHYGERTAQIARSDRLSGGEIGLDDALEDLARALVELTQADGAVAHRSKDVD